MAHSDPIIYEVTLQVDPPLAEAVEDHMRRHHIPGILRTGCFERIRLDRGSSGQFRTTYQARSEADLERYLQEHAPAFRAEFQAEFPLGVTLTREIWRPREFWQSG
jgi:Domain of unknown function (DUF4286)